MALGPAKLREVASLSTKNARHESGRFLAEGAQALRELIKYPDSVEEVFVTEELYLRFADELDALTVPVTEVSESEMAKLADAKTPQGVIAVCRQFEFSLEAILENKPKLLVLLENVSDPGNAGAIIRVADASGADAVIFGKNSVDIYNPKLIRSTAGSIFHIPVLAGIDLERSMSAIKGTGLKVLAADASGTDVGELTDVLTSNHAWVFGNEAHGLSEEIIRHADELVSIPIFGAAESLNLATAASVLVYTSAFAQRR